LGKFSEAFQQYLLSVAGDSHEGERTGKVDHSSAGAQHAMASLPPPLNAMVAYAIAGHHSGLLDGLNIQRACLQARLRKTDLPPWRDRVPAAVLGTVEVSMPDLLATSRSELAFKLGFATRMLFSCLVDADFLATESFMNPEQAAERPTGKADFAALNVHLTAYLDSRFTQSEGRVAESRAVVLAACREKANGKPGLYSLTVPTGGGKTLSSLAFALRHCETNGLNRVIYAIPFTSIIEQTANEFRSVFETFPAEIDHLILEHHSNFDPEKETTRSRLTSENWDSPLIVTTNVQLFESLFANKPSRCRKLHRIANSVIILDEAQTIPVTLLAPCLRVLELLVHQYGCTVVLCTATQPAIEKREEFPIGLPLPMPIIENAAALYSTLKRVEVRNAGVMSCAALAARMAENPQGLAIVNTRRHATALYNSLRTLVDEEDCCHLSAAMTPEHRTRKLVEIRVRLSRGQPCRVVATQLIEAGVDVDFPVVWRALAGLDSIAQAAGRCNREGRLTDAVTWIFEPEEEQFSRLFGTIKTGANAASQVIGCGHDHDLLGLAAIEHYFRLHYWSHAQDWDTHAICEAFQVGDGELPLNGAFATVAERFRFIDDAQRPVVVGWDKKGRGLVNKLRRLDSLGIHPDRKLSRLLQRQTVAVSQRLWQRALQDRRIEILCDRFAVLTVPELCYHAELGLQLDADPLYDTRVLIQ
jgi:CRISPR-associated endonuclease/helicase Cas3